MIGAATEPRTGKTAVAARASWLVFAGAALMPALMALTSWSADGQHYQGIFLWRFFAPPILLLELVTLIAAVAAGAGPVQVMAEMSKPTRLGLAALASIMIGTTFLAAADQGDAVVRAAITALHISFGLAVGALVRSGGLNEPARLWRLLLGGAVLYLLIAFVFVATIPEPDSFNWLNFGLGVVNIRHAGFYVIVAAALGLAIAGLDGARLRYAGLAAATLACAFFFWSGARGPLFALAGGIAVTAMLVPTARRWRLAAFTIAALLVGGVVSLAHRPPHPVYGLVRIAFSGTLDTPDEMSSGRVGLWEGTLRTSLERPLFGHGEGQFMAIVPESQKTFHHPHNAPLQILFQWGIIGLLIAGALAFAAWRRILVHARSPEGAAIVPGFMLINVMLIYSLHDGIIFFVYPAMMLALLTAVCLGDPARRYLRAGTVQK